MSPARRKADTASAHRKSPPAPDASAGESVVKRRKSDLRREAILKAATELFDRQGFGNTSLDDVAQAVGITREALYYYYRSRAEILLAIIGPQAEGLIGGLREVMATDVPAPEKLRLAIHNHLKRFDRYCLEMTISVRDGIASNGEAGAAMTRIWKEYERMWTALVEAGLREGLFAPVGDAKMVAFAILGMCNWLARWYNPRKPASIDQIIDTYFMLTSQGLLPRKLPVARPAAKRRKA
ncbi:MAG: hypothetical protein RL522_214 [Pseudomonadota bacterium]